MHKKRRALYKPDERDKRKHKERWSEPEPGFVRDDDGYRVGQCPNDVSEAEAQRLLDDGIAYVGRAKRSPYPQRVYNVRRGIPYHAHQKAAGRYHGFPELPSNIPPKIRESLRIRAADEGYLDEYEAWQRDMDYEDD